MKVTLDLETSSKQLRESNTGFQPGPWTQCPPLKKLLRNDPDSFTTRTYSPFTNHTDTSVKGPLLRAGKKGPEGALVVG
ncbi:hypothetical protein J6590_053444 [Homalodisca vitripennis]|nr:hypothetical protein J6590_053444 [Homalodisca vitripennis]